MKRRKSGIVTINAVSGTHVVFLGMNMAKKDANNVIGFAIQRQDFIEQARDNSYDLCAAIFEVQYPEVLKAFQDAKKRGASVQIIYEATPGSDTAEGNNKIINKMNMNSLFKERRNGKLMHNKFIILCKNHIPISVWTGSTNLSENALYGQLNVAHMIEDKAAARVYHDYLQQLCNDTETADMKNWMTDHNELPLVTAGLPVSVIFSPHRGKAVFDWYKDIASSAIDALFMTFPFGIVADFRPVFDKKDGVLRFALLDKYVNGGTKESRKAAIDDTIRIRQLPNVGMALGSRIFMDDIDGWIKESVGLGTFVNWVHTKFMLVDPLGKNPTTISGSANWSLPSTNENDENMVVIRKNKRVAHIYFTEFMRIFAHHRFRESVQIYFDKHKTTEGWRPQDLFENPCDWVPKHYAPGSEYELKRNYFSK